MFDTVTDFSAGTFKFKGKATHEYVPIFPHFYANEGVSKVSVYFFNKQKKEVASYSSRTDLA